MFRDQKEVLWTVHLNVFFFFFGLSIVYLNKVVLHFLIC